MVVFVMGKYLNNPEIVNLRVRYIPNYYLWNSNAEKMAGMLSLCHIELLTNLSLFLKGLNRFVFINVIFVPCVYFSIFNLVHNVCIDYICMYVSIYVCIFMYVYLLAHVALVAWVELIKSWILNLEQIKNVFILYIVWGEILQNFVYFGKLLWYCTDRFFKIKKNTDIQYLTKAKLVKKNKKKEEKKPPYVV